MVAVDGDNGLGAFAGAFVSIQLRISAQNLTSRTEISDGAPASPPIALLEFLKHGLVLEMPKNSCARGHSLAVDVAVIEPAANRMKLAITGKVDSVVKHREGVDRVELTLVQFEDHAWERLLGTYASRQLEIEDFFKAAKGY